MSLFTATVDLMDRIERAMEPDSETLLRQVFGALPCAGAGALPCGCCAECGCVCEGMGR